MLHYFRKASLDPQIGQEYVREVAELIPGALVSVEKKPSGEYAVVKLADRPAGVASLLARSEDWLRIIEQSMQRIQKAAEAGGEYPAAASRPAT